MQSLASHPISSVQETHEEDAGVLPLDEVDVLLGEERLTEAFFLARRMAAEGIEGAIEKVEEIRSML